MEESRRSEREEVTEHTLSSEEESAEEGGEEATEAGRSSEGMEELSSFFEEEASEEEGGSSVTGRSASSAEEEAGEEEEEEGGRIRAAKVFRKRALPFEESDDVAFKKDYRFTKRVFYRICDLVADKLRRTSFRSRPLTIPQQVAICLNLLGRNSKQRDAARMGGCEQPTVHRVLVDFVDAICAHAGRFIFWPAEEERRRISQAIFSSYKLPNIVGFIDGSHVRIIAPHENEADFVNRKQYHSINVGLICDDNLRFRWMSAAFPGSAHDSRVFKESQLYQDMKNARKPGCIIGDSAYAAESFLIKVVDNPQSQAEQRYNRALCAARSHIERAIGVLKAQFKILGEECRYQPELATKIITTCVVLRNIAIDCDETFDDFEPVDEERIDEEAEDLAEPALAGRATMRRIINDYFT